MQKVRKAVIPVAGLGTRFLPVTKALPKEMLPIVDKPVIQYIVEEAVESGIDEIIFVTSENKIAIENHFDRNAALECLLEQKKKSNELSAVKDVAEMAEFIFVRQTDPLGLGHAVLQAKDVIGDDPFVVFGGDDVVEYESAPAAKQLIDVYERHSDPVIGVLEVPKEAVNRYGIIDPVEDMGENVARIKDIIEKPDVDVAPSQLGVGGRWLLTPDIFDHLEQTKPGAGNEIQLTDAIRELMNHRDVYAKTYDGIYRDCGNKTEYIKAMIAFAVRHEELGPAVKEYIQSLDV